MIDHEALEETADGTAYDRLTALLIGLIAVLAASLVLVQASASQGEARANAAHARLTAELTTRIGVSGVLRTFQLSTFEQALQVGITGNAHSIVAQRDGDMAAAALGAAEANASTRLEVIAAEMGAVPDVTSALDAYIVSVLGAELEDMQAMAADQAAQFEVAQVASRRSGQAVLGLALAALSGVLVGLAAIVGGGRAGKALLLSAYLAAGAATAGLLLAAGVVG